MRFSGSRLLAPVVATLVMACGGADDQSAAAKPCAVNPCAAHPCAGHPGAASGMLDAGLTRSRAVLLNSTRDSSCSITGC